MNRRRRELPSLAGAASPLALGALVLLLVLGTGVVLLGTGPAAPPTAAEPETGGSPTTPAAPASATPRSEVPGSARAATATAALTLLQSAAIAVRERAWSGTERVSAWDAGTATTAVLAVSHTSTAGTRVRALQADGPILPVPSVAVDADLLGQLVDRYVLSVASVDTCAGRAAQVVEVRTTAGRLAGRFWLDRDTGLPLRREVWDRAGHLLRSSALESVAIATDPASGAPDSGAPDSGVRQSALATAPSRPSTASAGWDVPRDLAGGYLLYASDRPTRAAAMLHLSYSDGLSTVSVFSQPGSIGSGPGSGFQRSNGVGSTDGGSTDGSSTDGSSTDGSSTDGSSTDGSSTDGSSTDVGSSVWVRPGSPQRVVWGGAGQVFTVVSDAGMAETLAAVRGLPHDPAPASGLSARLSRGAARIGSWLDPTG